MKSMGTNASALRDILELTAKLILTNARRCLVGTEAHAWKTLVRVSIYAVALLDTLELVAQLTSTNVRQCLVKMGECAWMKPMLFSVSALEDIPESSVRLILMNACQCLV